MVARPSQRTRCDTEHSEGPALRRGAWRRIPSATSEPVHSAPLGSCRWTVASTDYCLSGAVPPEGCRLRPSDMSVGSDQPLGGALLLVLTSTVRLSLENGNLVGLLRSLSGAVMSATANVDR